MGELGQGGTSPRIGRLPTGDDELDELLRAWDKGHLRGEGPEEVSREIARRTLDEDWEFLDKFDAATGYEASKYFDETSYNDDYRASRD